MMWACLPLLSFLVHEKQSVWFSMGIWRGEAYDFKFGSIAFSPKFHLCTVLATSKLKHEFYQNTKLNGIWNDCRHLSPHSFNEWNCGVWGSSLYLLIACLSLGKCMLINVWNQSGKYIGLQHIDIKVLVYSSRKFKNLFTLNDLSSAAFQSLF